MNEVVDGAPPPRRRPTWLIALASAIVGAAVVVGIWLVLDSGSEDSNTETYTVPSESMEPTFSVGDPLTVDLDAYSGEDPDNGEVVVFHPPIGADVGSGCGVSARQGEPCPEPTPESSDQLFLKRIVAGPGDTLSIVDGYAVVNGKQASEPYILPCGSASACNMPVTITIPPDHYFLLGDNRGASDDSRFWGPVPVAAILGRVE